MKLGIGIDLSGMVIKEVAFDCAEGRLVSQESAPTGDGEMPVAGRPAFAHEVAGLVAKLEQQSGTEADILGLSATGMANAEADRIAFIPNRLDGLDDFDWSACLDRPVRVLNDAQAAPQLPSNPGPRAA